MKNLSYLFILFLLSGCSENVTFNKPQPPDTTAISSFPSKLQGKYIHKDEGSGIEITPSMIRDVIDRTMAVKDLDSNHILSGDSLLDRSSGEKHKVMLIGDSIFMHIDMDTVFSMSATNVLKKYKGYYFVNIKLDKDEWRVYRLNLDRNMLVSGKIQDSADIVALKELAPSTKDSTGYHFKPSQKQFDKYLKKDGFKDRDTFFKITSAPSDAPF